jgi:hypothetical protein
LPISTTPKLHILYHHVGQFIQQTRKTLGLFSEQSAESLHHDFEGQWNGRFKRDMSHPDYQSQLLNCVVEYNSKRLRFKARKGEVKVEGDDLVLDGFAYGQLVVKGKITSIEFLS